MGMVKICSMPRLVENEDRWGIPQGTYSVLYTVGLVEQNYWTDLEDMQRYSERFGDEIKSILKDVSTIMHDINKINAPNLKRVTRHGLVRQFNMMVEGSRREVAAGVTESEYVRAVCYFDKVTLFEYTPSFDEAAKKLQAEADKLNSGEKNETPS